MEENKDIKEAKEELDEISKDEVLRRMALKAELERRDIGQIRYDAEQKGIKEGREEGRKEGREEGRKEGRTEATKETKEEIVKKMYEIDITVEHIAKVVNLEVSEVKKILNL